MSTFYLKSLKNVVKYWYLPLLVGLFFIIVGLVAFTAPEESFLALGLLFSLGFVFGGISEILFSLGNRQVMENWGWSLAFGIFTFVVGVLLFLNPTLSMTTLAFYIGFVVLFRSVAAISFSLDIKRYGGRAWGSLLALGILGVLFSFILLWNPIFAGMGVVFLVGLSFLFTGGFSILFALQLRKVHKNRKKISAQLHERYEALMEEMEREMTSH
ncbi:HdeD family acid-resistance protein [Maribacter sp. 2307ULW6-5]|uniref:HdeD family acid-resistance protein n=1 Tax=Maribacter sp. 2307ULW6-5 TaxID=3386275 RepID=UPI0039BCC04C